MSKTNTLLDTMVICCNTESEEKELMSYLQATYPNLRWATSGNLPKDSCSHNGHPTYITATLAEGKTGICSSSKAAGRDGQFAGRILVDFEDLSLPEVKIFIGSYEVKFAPNGSSITVGYNTVTLETLVEIVERLESMV